MSKELILYCDESDKDGPHFANFYGGLLIRSQDLETCIQELADKKTELGFTGELKWQKVTPFFLNNYLAFIDFLFDFIEKDLIKVRIMFTQKYFAAVGLSKEQKQNEYFLLYYQFIKHAFGLTHAAKESDSRVGLRIHFDQLPDTREKCEQFKDYIANLNRNKQFSEAGVILSRNQLAEVDSKDHILLQCIDLILGSIQFRLNDKHLQKPAGKTRRGKKTIAKEKLYKQINRRIRDIYPNFNVGISTGTEGDATKKWDHPYRHWLFMPNNAAINPAAAKKK